MPQLANFRTYAEGDSASRVNGNSKVLSIGFSDGGRLSTFANLFNADPPYVHTGIGVAGHAQDEWQTEPSGGGLVGTNGMETSGIRIHAYWTDNDYFYESTAFPGYASHLGLGSASSTTTSHDGFSFTKQSWTGDCCSDGSNCQTRVTWEVHDSTSTPNFGSEGTAYNMPSHGAFCSNIDMFDSIVTTGLSQFIVDLGFTGCGGGAHRRRGGGIIRDDLWLVELKADTARKRAETATDKSPKSRDSDTPSLATFTAAASNRINDKLAKATLERERNFVKLDREISGKAWF